MRVQVTTSRQTGFQRQTLPPSSLLRAPFLRTRRSGRNRQVYTDFSCLKTRRTYFQDTSITSWTVRQRFLLAQLVFSTSSVNLQGKSGWRVGGKLLTVKTENDNIKRSRETTKMQTHDCPRAT